MPLRDFWTVGLHYRPEVSFSFITLTEDDGRENH
jgi:hypothetical protein